jgi:NADPH:quinone reductase-like Zn-dependent oxidoreductase
MTMAWELRDGFGVERLARRSRELRDPGPGEARVELRAWSLNYRDLLVVTGQYNPKQRLPLVPLSDAVGIVDAIGAGVTRVKVGDRVSPAFAQRWIAGPADRAKLGSTLGSPNDGTAARHVVLDAEGLVHVPAYLTDEEAATLPCAAVTAWSALYEHGALAPGQTVLVQGTGGVSIFALQLARLGGARVIVTSSSEAKLQLAKELGAWATIHYASERNWGRAARELSGGGVDHVIEVGGAGTMEESLAAVRPGGTISVIGVLAGAAGPIALTRVLMNVVRLQGILVGPREAFERMLRAIEAAQLRPVIDAGRFSFEELPAALEHMKSGAHFGKIALSDAARSIPPRASEG